MSPKRSRLHPSFVKDSVVFFFFFFFILSRLEPAQDSNFEVVLGWFLLSSVATSCLCSSRALTVLAALGTTPGLQPAPVGGGPLASGLSLQPPGPVPVA